MCKNHIFNIYLAESLCDTSCAPICPERRPNFDSKTTKNVRLKILSSFLISSLFPFSSDDLRSQIIYTKGFPCASTKISQFQTHKYFLMELGVLS